jgi:hypothetical protein
MSWSAGSRPGSSGGAVIDLGELVTILDLHPQGLTVSAITPLRSGSQAGQTTCCKFQTDDLLPTNSKQTDARKIR